jgi:uncharacterized protein (TIGR02147 family)
MLPIYSAAMSPSYMPCIFDYAEPALYLKAVLQSRKIKNPRFSLRAWAKELGLREPTPLTLILNGTRPLPLHYLSKLETSLSLTGPERRYLEARILEKSSKTGEEKTRWARSAEQIVRKAKLHPKKMPDFKLFENPLVMLLHVLTELPDFKMDTAWISQKIGQTASTQTIQSIYDQLVAEGYLELDTATGKTTRTDKHLWSSQDIPSAAIKSFHELSLKSAIAALHRQDVSEREFGSYLYTARASDLPRMKKRIREFISGLIAEFSDQADEDSVYHLNLNLFPRTKKKANVA